MYVSLGLLWLCFEVIHGVITRCPMGGVIEEELGLSIVDGKLVATDMCTKLIKETALEKLNLYGYQHPINRDQSNEYDVYDIPYNNFKEKSVKAVNSQLNTLNLVQLMSIDPEPNISYSRIVFRQSLMMSDYINIKDVWDKTLLIGTDTYRLKFHNKLYSKYKGKATTMRAEECFVFIESYYIAASTYYFMSKNTLAKYLIKDGIDFGELVLNTNMEFRDIDSMESKELRAWLLLCDSLKHDIRFIETQSGEEINIIEKSSKPKQRYLSLFSPSVLHYRRYFLDNKLDELLKNKLEEWAKEYFESVEDTDIIFTKNNSMYNYLLLSNFGKTDEVKFKNIINAIKWPVLSIEDRLLNYKALEIIMEMLHCCLDDNQLLEMSKYCKLMNKLKDENESFREIIIPKLKNVRYVTRHNQKDHDIIRKLIEELSKEDKINERTLHVIVTSAIDILDVNKKKYKRITDNILSAIRVLKYYTRVQLKESTLEDNCTENVIEDNPEVDEILKNMMVRAFTKPNLDDEQKRNNIFIAYKWIAELYGVLCNSKHLKKYQNRLKEFIESAKTYEKDDDHLKYLKNKLDAKILLANNSWEFSTFPSGWNFKNLNKENSELYKEAINRNILEIIEELNFLKNNSNCLYINKIEINILLYRLYVLNSVRPDYTQLYPYIQSAVHEIVITSEDRVRNMEAHELLSMYLMMRNRYAIEQRDVNYNIYSRNLNRVFHVILPLHIEIK